MESVTIADKTLKPTIAVFTPAALTAGDTLIIAGTDLDLVSAIVFAGEDSPTAMLAKYNHISDELLGITVPGVAETCAPTLILKNGMEVKTTLTLILLLPLILLLLQLIRVLLFNVNL